MNDGTSSLAFANDLALLGFEGRYSSTIKELTETAQKAFLRVYFTITVIMTNIESLVEKKIKIKCEEIFPTILNT